MYAVTVRNHLRRHREHHHKITSGGRPSEQFPAPLASSRGSRNDDMAACCRLLDFSRGHAVGGDVANIMYIPLEAEKAIQQATSIYK